MNLIKRLLNRGRKTGCVLAMCPDSKPENSFFSTGEVTIEDDCLKIENYPFEPSVAYAETVFSATHIDDIDCNANPPSVRIKDELIYVSSEKRSALESFAKKNNIAIVERPMIWEWLLEPFLDTEYTKETDQRLTALLNSYGLTIDQIRSIRAEVETPMLNYNFDTMLWEWHGLGAPDVLNAMRTKYNKDKYRNFYERVMNIALLSKKKPG